MTPLSPTGLAPVYPPPPPRKSRAAPGAPIPTMLVTGDTAEERLTEVTSSGFALLRKPFDADDLRRTMATLLRKGNDRREPSAPRDEA